MVSLTHIEDPPSAPLACDGLVTAGTPLGEQLGEAVSTERFVIPGGEPLASQDLVAVVAGEALPVVRIIAVSHSSRRDDLQ